MSSREANIEKLNYAIMSLNEDAEGIHGLIARSADKLESATAAGNRAADNASQIIEALTPLTELLETQHSDSAAMLEEARKAAKEQRTAAVEQASTLRETVTEALEAVGTKTEAACDCLVKTVEGSFEDIKAKTLKEHERTRDELQTDILGFKNATSARLDTLEAEAVKTQSAIKELETRITECTGAIGKKLFVPICVAIGLGAADLICLVVLLMK